MYEFNFMTIGHRLRLRHGAEIASGTWPKHADQHDGVHKTTLRTNIVMHFERGASICGYYLVTKPVESDSGTLP